MSNIRVELAREFMFGDDVVLLAMDGIGLDLFLELLQEAMLKGRSRLEHQGVSHDVVIEAIGSSVDMADRHITWRFNSATANEVVDYLTALRSSNRPGHQYVDISEPTDTLVLSLDEYMAK
ncbi:MAG: hypothetical protein HZB45_23045 [Mycolicibacterium rufum]|nr:hypothetical protein [Mycolicibacterium rufum]